MKNQIVLGVFGALALFSCKKKGDLPVTKVEDQTKSLVVDSLIFKDSAKVGKDVMAYYSAKTLLFPGIKDKAILDSIYRQFPAEHYDKASLEAKQKDAATNFFAKNVNNQYDLGTDLFYTSNMKVLYQEHNYLVLQYRWDYYEGGAHPGFNFHERAFDLEKNKMLELKDITTMPSEKLSALLKQNVDKILPKGEGEGLKNSDALLLEKIPTTGNFYFDNQNLYFHFSPYEIASFSVGDVVIPVSYEELKGTLNADFKKRMNL